jgi:surface polysaccharide O-acyltransferase-like enzyme
VADKTNNIQYLDTLRALAILGVIIIHISSPLVNMTYGKNMPYWWIGNVVDSAVRFAVPLFLMLSGATMLGKDYKTGEYYWKRIIRVLVPFLFWIAVYWIYRWITLLPKQQPHDFQTILSWAGNLFLKEGVSKHFWYIYMILVIYLFVPFMGKGFRKLNSKMMLNLLLFWVVLTFVCKSIPLNMYSWAGDYGSKLLAYLLYSGYLVLGYYLSELPFTSQKICHSAAVIFLFTVIISGIFTYIFSKHSHKPDLTMYSYLSINTIIQTIAIFMWVKNFSIKNKYIFSVQSTISNYSYGIYLVHIMIIGILFQYGIYWSFANPLISLPLLTGIVLVCSFGIIYLLRKIPFGKLVAG